MKIFGAAFFVQVGLSALLALSVVAAFDHWRSTNAPNEPIHCVGYSKHACFVPFPAIYARSPDAYGDLPIAVVGCVFTDGAGQYFLAPDLQIANRGMVDYALRLAFEQGPVAQSVSQKVGNCVRAFGRLRTPPEGSLRWADLELIEEVAFDVGPDSPWGGDARGLPPPPAPPRPTE